VSAEGQPEARAGSSCSGCGRDVAECVACEDKPCGAPVCYSCLNVTLRQAEPTAHQHGG
jgi:hypothetical protein